jgi:hypothetical protein
MKQIACVTRTLFDDNNELIIRILFPELVNEAESEWWSCRFHLILDDKIVDQGEGLGSDGVQALLGALEHVRLKLKQGNFSAFRWFEDGEPGESGIPVFVPYIFGNAFSKKVQDFIEATLQEREQAILRELEQKQSKSR